MSSADTTRLDREKPVSGPPLRPCVFFDRDGIVNVSPGPGYVERPEDFHLVSAWLDALRVTNERGYAAVIITNQRGVGRGLMKEKTLAEIHALVRQAVAAQGLVLDDIYYCSATDNAHPDRKPNPGMLLRAARDHRLDLARSWMVGDNESDVEAGHRAGCRAVRVSTDSEATAAEFHIPDMADLPALLQKLL